MDYGHKRKILLIVPHFQNGGQERICALTADLLAEKYDVWVVLFDGRDALYHTTAPVINIDMPAENNLVIRKIICALKRGRAVKKIKKEMDITHSFSFGETANLVNVLSKTHDIIIGGIRGNTQANSRLTKKMILPRLNKAITVSKEMEDELQKKFPEKEFVFIPNPVDMEGIQQKANDTGKKLRKTHTFKIYTMGRVVWEKGYWHLLKACAHLIKKGYDIELVHAGFGDVGKYIMLAKKLSIADRVFFRGQLANPFAEMRDTDLFVMSSCSEGWPNAIVEAMAIGIPVVSTNCRTGPAEILHKNWKEAIAHRNEVFMADYGVLAPEVSRIENMNAADVEKEDFLLSDAMEAMLADQTVREKYRKEGMIRAADFSKEKYLDRLNHSLIMKGS